MRSRPVEQWSSREHAAAAVALGDEARMLMHVARETSDDRAEIYGLCLRWTVQRAVRHARFAIGHEPS